MSNDSDLIVVSEADLSAPAQQALQVLVDQRDRRGRADPAAPASPRRDPASH